MDRFVELREKILPLLRPYVRRISVFGSFARGEDTAESDIDILVDLKQPGERPFIGLRWFGLEQELGRVFGPRGGADQRERPVSLHPAARGKRYGAAL